MTEQSFPAHILHSLFSSSTPLCLTMEWSLLMLSFGAIKEAIAFLWSPSRLSCYHLHLENVYK